MTVSSIFCIGHPSLWVSPFSQNTYPCEGRGLTTALNVPASSPSWGPDDLIAYAEGMDPADIAIVSAVTRERCTVALPGDDANPSWVPAGFVDPGWFEPL